MLFLKSQTLLIAECPPLKGSLTPVGLIQPSGSWYTTGCPLKGRLTWARSEKRRGCTVSVMFWLRTLEETS